jgi:hypothetical protein
MFQVPWVQEQTLTGQALVQAKLGHTYQSIQMATYGIAFFGTPHRGSQLAKLGETVAKAVRAFLRTPNNTFINALKENDLYANELSANFSQLLEDYKYINFYETLPLRSLGIVCRRTNPLLLLLFTITNKPIFPHRL